MSNESLWKDAEISIAWRDDDDFGILCSRCNNIIEFTYKELQNSTVDNPIICKSCGLQIYLDESLDYLLDPIEIVEVIEDLTT
jgi:hypothetical protein